MDPPNAPTHYYSLALCTHIIAYICSVIAAFTPDWSAITETTAALTKVTYDKGAMVSCDVPGESSGCNFNKDISGASTPFFLCFLVVILYMIVGFFALQLLVAGMCVRSLKERNLGIPLVAHFVILIVLVILAITMFEASVTRDITDGNEYDTHVFGISRFVLVACVVLYFVCTFFALAEYFKRKGNNSVSHTNSPVYAMDSIPPTPKSKSRSAYDRDSVKNNNNSKRNSEVNVDTKDTNNKFTKTANINKWPTTARVLGYDDYNLTPNKHKKATTSIIPLEGHTYFR